MKNLQKWFERIAGISHDELERQARAREIFSQLPADIAALQKPACWRRPRRVRS